MVVAYREASVTSSIMVDSTRPSRACLLARVERARARVLESLKRAADIWKKNARVRAQAAETIAESRRIREETRRIIWTCQNGMVTCIHTADREHEIAVMVREDLVWSRVFPDYHDAINEAERIRQLFCD